MPFDKISDYIRSLRLRYTDREIREALRLKGYRKAEVQSAFREAGALRASRARPLARGSGGWLLAAVAMCAGLMVAVALMRSRPGSRIAEPTRADFDAYRPAPFAAPSLAGVYLPKQSDGNAAEDYLRAGKLYLELGRPRVDERTLDGILAPVMAAIEAGTAKSRYEDFGVVAAPATAAAQLRSMRELAQASFFCAAMGARVERLAGQGKFAEAEAEARRMLALGHHHAQSWLLFLQAPQGNECMMAAALRLGTVLSRAGRATETEKNRLGMLGKEIVAGTPDPAEVRSILSRAERPARIPSLDVYLDREELRRPYLLAALSGAAYGWSPQEAAEDAPDPAREEYLERAARHPDPRVSALGKGQLSQLLEVRVYLRGIPREQRWRALQEMRGRLFGFKGG